MAKRKAKRSPAKKAKKAARKRVVLPHHRVKVGIAFEPGVLAWVEWESAREGVSRSAFVNSAVRVVRALREEGRR